MSPFAILTYHSLDDGGSVLSTAPALFAEQMMHLADLGVRGISLGEAVSHWRMHERWPDDAVALTFDDGYANFAEYALPILARHGGHATVFVVSEHIGGFNDWQNPPAALGTQPMLGWRQIADCHAAGIEIGIHTRTHPDLRQLSGTTLEEEIAGAKETVEERLGEPVQSFAYPYGKSSEAARRVVAREFRAACTTELRRVGEAANAFALPRIDMYYLRHARALVDLYGGRLDRALTARRWLRRLRGTD